MFTRIRIYNATDTSVEYDNLNNDFGIESGSLYLNRRITTQDLEFGQFNSALFQCTVFGFEDDIQGRHIVVSQIDDNDVETNRFNGIIDSAKRDRLGEDRTISAYDWMYYHRDDNMATFWNNYWSNIQDSTIVDFRNALLTYLGVPNNPATLPNDSVVIKNAFIDQPVTKLPLNGLMKTLCTVSGAFVYVDENGYLTFKTLSSTTVADLTGKVEGQNSEWEDYTTKQITGIGVYDTSNNLAQLVGTSDNVYNIVGNYFFLSMDATQLTSVCNTLLTSLQGVQYVPAKLALKLPEDLSLGDYVQTDNGNTYVFSIELSGVAFVNQKIESSASGDTLPQTVEFEEDTLIQGAKISRLQKDIDGLDSEFRDLETEIGENYYTKTQTDSAISQSATQIKTEVTEEVTEAVLEQVGGQADNLIPYPYAFDSQEINGLTFTVSDVDGSITVDGTATDDTDFIIIDITRTDYNMVTLSKLDYVISGCPEDGSLNTYYLAVSQSNGTSVIDIARDYGHKIVGGLSNKFTVTDDESPIGCYIHVASGTTVEDIVFKPQLEYGQAKHEYQYTTTSKTSKIDQHSDEIVLKVDSSGKIVEVNLSAHPSTGSEFKVSADNISFIANDTIQLTSNNLAINSTNFSVDTTGRIIATSGNIGGWEITSDGFKKTKTQSGYTASSVVQPGKIELYGNDIVDTTNVTITNQAISLNYIQPNNTIQNMLVLDATAQDDIVLETSHIAVVGGLQSTGVITAFSDINFKKQNSNQSYLNFMNASGVTMGYIQDTGIDGATLNTKNNIHISSWWGLSFGTNCPNQTYTDKAAVSINTRNGNIQAGGNISCTYLTPSNAAQTRTNLGLGSIATKNSNDYLPYGATQKAASGSGKTVNAGVILDCCSIAITVGTWIVTYSASFPSGASNKSTCGCLVSTAAGSSSPVCHGALVNVYYTNANENRNGNAFLYYASGNVTLHLGLWARGSGNITNCAGEIRAFRIG